MDFQATHLMTIGNSIIGVSILAMPYCFKQCGIVLSVLILILSSILSRLSCHLLLKSAILARRRTFEFLAFHAFGPLGKFIIEIGIIGFLVGTCIGFFVVMGDLAPEIVAKMTGTKATDTLRTSILMALALFCVLPLGLLRNVDSLNSVCTTTMGFYACLVLKIMAEAMGHIISGNWFSKLEVWNPSGVLQCLPIFTMALFCQTQLFEIYQAIPNASLEKMNNLVKTAVNYCTACYIFVGIFGYIAFASQPFTGNILMSFSPSLVSEVMKIGFVLSVAFSFPLVIFPCRASLYSLLYKQTYSALHEGSSNYISEGRFKGLTFLIVFVSLFTGIMIPNIELVLGLVGSTIGIMICVIFPATCFICITTKNTNERVLAQIMLFVGILVMVLGTYANLYAMEEISSPIGEKLVEKVEIGKAPVINQAVSITTVPALPLDILKQGPKIEMAKEAAKENLVFDLPKVEEPLKEVRHEPPQPEEPPESEPKPKEAAVPRLETPPITAIPKPDTNIKVAEPDAKIENNSANFPKTPLPEVMSETKMHDEIDIEAIKKEEKELEEGKKEEGNNKNVNLVLQDLQQQSIVQQQILEDSKKVLEEIRQRQVAQDDEKKKMELEALNMEKRKAVEKISKIAKMAIEKLGGKNAAPLNLVLNRTNLIPLPLVIANNSIPNKILPDETKDTEKPPVKLIDILKANPNPSPVLDTNKSFDRETRSAESAKGKESKPIEKIKEVRQEVEKAINEIEQAAMLASKTVRDATLKPAKIKDKANANSSVGEKDANVKVGAEKGETIKADIQDVIKKDIVDEENQNVNIKNVKHENVEVGEWVEEGGGKKIKGVKVSEEMKQSEAFKEVGKETCSDCDKDVPKLTNPGVINLPKIRPDLEQQPRGFESVDGDLR